jgi:hypothetical protein
VVEYDDGPYVGSAILLTHGILPYRDYIFVQPPGITLILAPLASLARFGWIGPPAVMATGRVLTALVSTAGVPLLGVLVRRRGVAAVTVGCGLLAVYPGSIFTGHTVLLEPWLTLCCLAGAIIVFAGDRLATSTRRLVWGGVVFGVAGAIEVWAIVPVVVIAALCLPRLRRAIRFAAGAGAGFLVPVLPFALLSPHGFYQGVITAQIGHRPNAIRVSPLYRFKEMAGLDWVHPWSGFATVVVALGIVVVVITAMIAVAVITGRPPAPLDWFAVLVAAATVVMFMSPSQFLYHFMGFFGPFLAMSLALPFARCADVIRELLPIARGHWPGAALAGLAAPLIAVMAVMQVSALSTFPPWPLPSPELDRLIPPGACVLSDTAPVLIMTNRLISNVPGCTTMLDSMGADLALSHGLKPDTGAWKVRAVEEWWWHAFRHAQYVLLRVNPLISPRVPWTPQLETYFNRNFKLIFRQNFVPYDLTFPGAVVSYRLYARNTLARRHILRPALAPGHSRWPPRRTHHTHRHRVFTPSRENPRTPKPPAAQPA